MQIFRKVFIMVCIVFTTLTSRALCADMCTLTFGSIVLDQRHLVRCKIEKLLYFLCVKTRIPELLDSDQFAEPAVRNAFKDLLSSTDLQQWGQLRQKHYFLQRIQCRNNSIVK
jgi:hypothetical protein